MADHTFPGRAGARALSSLGVVMLVTVLSVASHDTARAAATPTPSPGALFGVHPVQEGSTTLPGGHFNFALVPGQSVSDAIVVENFSDHSLLFHIYGADLITAAGGGLAPAQPAATMHAAGAWIKVARPTITIPAHGQDTDSFTLTLPTGTSPGQHLGAVVASADVGLTTQGSPIEARTALITVITVPGTVHASGRITALSGSAPTSGETAFAITLANTGNVLLTYSGSVKIDDGKGRLVATIPLTPAGAYVVPKGQVPLAALWKKNASASGAYRAQATVTILADGKAVATLTSQSLALQSSSGPTLPLVGIALALVAILLLAAWFLRRSTHQRIRPLTRTALGTGRTGAH